MVRAVGLEPTCLAAADFESAASTNSATPATRPAYTRRPVRRNRLSGTLPDFLRRWPRRSGTTTRRAAAHILGNHFGCVTIAESVNAALISGTRRGYDA